MWTAWCVIYVPVVVQVTFCTHTLRFNSLFATHKPTMCRIIFGRTGIRVCFCAYRRSSHVYGRADRHAWQTKSRRCRTSTDEQIGARGKQRVNGYYFKYSYLHKVNRMSAKWPNNHAQYESVWNLPVFNRSPHIGSFHTNSPKKNTILHLTISEFVQIWYT